MKSRTVLQRLLRYPHTAVFDDSPEAELAFRLQHPLGARRAIADRKFTASAGDDSWEFDLGALTVDQLCDELEALGFTLESRAARFVGMSGVVLVDGEGDQLASNGDHIYAFTSVLWALFSGYAAELLHAEDQVLQAILQMFIPSAEGEWLNVWGTLYGVPRGQHETDAALRARIPREVFRLRQNRYAIEQAIKEDTGYDVEIREPNKLMFRLSVSQLSGTHHFHDSDYYTHNIIQPVAGESIDWPRVLQVIERNRAAGVLVYSPAVEFNVRHVIAQPPVEYIAGMSAHQLYALGVWRSTEAVLGVMRLSDNTIGLNHLVMSYHLSSYANSVGVTTAQSIGRPRDIPYAAVVLSDGVPLGDENAIFSRGQRHVEFDPVPTVSDYLALSDYTATEVQRLVERVSIAQFAAAAEAPTDREAGSNVEDGRAFAAEAYPDTLNPWLGPWDDRIWVGWRYVGMAMTSTPA